MPFGDDTTLFVFKSNIEYLFSEAKLQINKLCAQNTPTPPQAQVMSSKLICFIKFMYMINLLNIRSV